MSEEISDKLFSDLRDIVSEEDDCSQVSSTASQINISFDIDFLTEADTRKSTVYFFIEKIAPDLRASISIDSLMQSMLENPDLSSIIKIACDASEDLDEASGLIDEDDQISGVIAAVPMSLSSTPKASYLKNIVAYLNPKCPQFANGLEEIIANRESMIFFLINERAPYIPNQVGSQVLENLFEKIQGTASPYFLIFAKMLFVNNTADSGEPNSKRIKGRNIQNVNERVVEFVKPEEEIFVPHQSVIRARDDRFYITTDSEFFTCDKEYENQPVDEIPIAIPMLISSGSTSVRGNERRTTLQWLIKDLKALCIQS